MGVGAGDRETLRCRESGTAAPNIRLGGARYDAQQCRTQNSEVLEMAADAVGLTVLVVVFLVLRIQGFRRKRLVEGRRRCRHRGGIRNGLLVREHRREIEKAESHQSADERSNQRDATAAGRQTPCTVHVRCPRGFSIGKSYSCGGAEAFGKDPDCRFRYG